MTNSKGLTITHRSALTKTQAVRAFFDSQGGEAVCFGKLKDDVAVLIECLARCGDKK